MFYADYLKIFKTIGSRDNALVLQENLSIINEWCSDNYMELNVVKCTCISFSRKRNCNKYVYVCTISDVKISRCNMMNDLGVLIDDKVNMNNHIENITNKARRMLSLVKRQAKIFNEPYVTKSLYCALVRSIVEYCNVAWMPFTRKQIDALESIQK